MLGLKLNHVSKKGPQDNDMNSNDSPKELHKAS